MKQNKTYFTTLNLWDFSRIIAQKSQGDDNYRLVVSGRVKEGGTKEHYILSNPCSSGITMARFKQFEELIKDHKTMGAPILIFYVKRFGKRFIQDVQ